MIESSETGLFEIHDVGVLEQRSPKSGEVKMEGAKTGDPFIKVLAHMFLPFFT